MNTDIKEIRIFSNNEVKQDDMLHRMQSPKVKFYICDICAKRTIDSVISSVNYVFYVYRL